MEVNRSILLPSLLTIGNGVCGFLAIVCLAQVQSTPEEGLALASISKVAQAAWLIFLGMVFDVFDGRVARASGGGSALGAQLDSLCDLITFGVAPAFMILALNVGLPNPAWQKVVMIFSIAYFVGALLRLARFTVENSPDESAHLAFKGLPTPGAAGCVASLVIFYCYVVEFRQPELQWVSTYIEPNTLRNAVSVVPYALPLVGLVLGFAMVSNRLIFEHAGSWIFSRKHSFDGIAYIVFGAVLAAVVPEMVLPIVFVGYVVYTPIAYLVRAITRKGRGASAEAPDDGTQAGA